MSEELVKTSIEDHILRIRLNRPQKLNAINDGVLAGLLAAMDIAYHDPDVRVVLLEGEGRSFSAGGDLEGVRLMTTGQKSFEEFLTLWHETFDRIEACPKPVVAAVRGHALAGGFELLLVCDVVVLSDNAKIGDQHARFGLYPGGGATVRLPRLVGERHARWLLLSGEWITPDMAVTIGLANLVVPDDELDRVALQMATTLTERSQLINSKVKWMLEINARTDARVALEIERPIALEMMLSADTRDGVTDFAGRRDDPRSATR